MEKKDRRKWTNKFRALGKKKGSRQDFINLYKEMKKEKDQNTDKENVLKDEEHKALVRYVTSNGFTWNYNDATDRPGAMNDTPQMVRALMARASLEDWQEEPSHYTSQHFYHKYFWQIPYLHDILKNCGSTGEYWRVKLNLLQLL